MSSNFIKCLDSITLSASGSAGGTQYLDLVMEDWKFCRFVMEVSYEATSSVTGVTADLYGGMGTLSATATGAFPQVFWGATVPSNPSAHFGDNSVSVSTQSITAGSASPVSANTAFYFDFPQIRLPGLVRLKFANTDTVNPATVKLFADVS